MTKAQSEAAHFRRRLLERYGIVVNHGEYRALCRAAAESHSTIRQSMRTRLVPLDIRGVTVTCVYDTWRMRLVTALPQTPAPEAEEPAAS